MENPEFTPEALAALSQSVSLPPSRPEVNEQFPQLISLSKQQGFVTIQDINQAIPESLIDAELRPLVELKGEPEILARLAQIRAG